MIIDGIKGKERLMQKKKVEKGIEKKEHEHKYEFEDIVDTGDDIHKISVCSCGAKMIDKFIHTSTEFEEVK